MATEQITLGGGCFWCLEAVYQDLKGVEKVVSGYANGHKDNPTYREVCTGTTGHNEVVQLTYNPDVASLQDILNVFFTIHDPTTLNQQGADVGTQYRSGIYTHNEQQAQVARQTIERLTADGVWGDSIVTEVEPLKKFYVAEDYHQDYYKNNPNQGYCRVVIAPKVAKFRKQYLEQLKA